MKRYQVKKADKEWDDAGPDLLRTENNSEKQLKEYMKTLYGWYHRREDLEGNFLAWDGPVTKKLILNAFSAWSPNVDHRMFQIGRKPNKHKPVDIYAMSRLNLVREQFLEDCTADSETCYALMEYKFPSRRLAGAFSCRQVAGSSTWSQHAYGKGIDHSDPDPDNVIEQRTPQELDWCLRMCKEDYSLFPAHHLIGTQDRINEVQALKNEGWQIRDYNGDGSHTWHVHASTGLTDATGWPSCA